jgi:hypothetical protein
MTSINQNPEQQARDRIDKLLQDAGWSVQDKDKINLGASLGVAIREYPTDTGPVDYALFVDRQAVWYYDFRTNVRFTLKTNPMKPEDLQDFINCYHPFNRYDRAFPRKEMLALERDLYRKVES